MPSWMAWRGSLATTPEPSQAPSTAAPIMVTRVIGSTLTAAMKMKACATVGRA